jgi:PhnB protein
MIQINPYLTFPGNCEKAFTFYKSIFGGEYQHIGRFNEMPSKEGKPMPEEIGKLIMHVSLPIGNGSVLMGSDSAEAFGQATIIGNNFSISINADSKESADKLFAGLSNGGKITMPLENTFWGSYFGMLTDQFQIQWMISVENKNH